MYREREKILDLFDMVCGQRLTYNYMRIGGVSQDIPEEFLPALNKFIDSLPGFITEYDQLLAENEILLIRTKNVGILSKEAAINYSTAGPILRASGVKWISGRPTLTQSMIVFSLKYRQERKVMSTIAIALESKKCARVSALSSRQ